MADAWFREELAHFQELFGYKIDGHDVNSSTGVMKPGSRILRVIGDLLRQ